MVHNELLTRPLRWVHSAQPGPVSTTVHWSLGNLSTSSLPQRLVLLTPFSSLSTRNRRQHIPLPLPALGKPLTRCSRAWCVCPKPLNCLTLRTLVRHKLLCRTLPDVRSRLLSKGTRRRQHLWPRGLDVNELVNRRRMVVTSLVWVTSLVRVTNRSLFLLLQPHLLNLELWLLLPRSCC